MARQTHASDNGNGARLAAIPPAPILRAEREEPLAGVIRDALDSTREIVRDTVAIGVLEARRAGTDLIHKAGDVAGDVGPRIAWALTAAVFTVVGGVLGIIALFMAAAVLIPSVAARLGICAALFLIVAGIGAFQAGKKKAAAPAITDPDSPPEAQRASPIW